MYTIWWRFYANIMHIVIYNIQNCHNSYNFPAVLFHFLWHRCTLQEFGRLWKSPSTMTSSPTSSQSNGRCRRWCRNISNSGNGNKQNSNKFLNQILHRAFELLRGSQLALHLVPPKRKDRSKMKGEGWDIGECWMWIIGISYVFAPQPLLSHRTSLFFAGPRSPCPTASATTPVLRHLLVPCCNCPPPPPWK